MNKIHIKKHFTFLILLCFTLVGCIQEEDTVKGEYDKKGIITQIDIEGSRILVDDAETGLIWVTLNDNEDINNYKKGQEVVIWIDGGIDESYPAQANALHIEHSHSGNETVQHSLPKFNFKNEKFPPDLKGIVKINETRYEMTRGGFEWKKGNQTTQTDAASPTQIAENFKAIVVEPNSKATIEIEQNPNLSAYLWDSDRKKIALEGKQITFPANKGRYIYEVVAKWSNGEVSYTFVIEVN
ncbi:DUF3221 domain-containing protein [Cytobacillus dafuensis]|uniref:DUF3221 domain-containing protein n=1 Tax=Cytobacillus dafuensis TaxID=1742359 RepID=UPI00071054DC|nr:DUF3221 domain-containing protein [Cytobacillus dafuensis]